MFVDPFFQFLEHLTFNVFVLLSCVLSAALLLRPKWHALTKPKRRRKRTSKLSGSSRVRDPNTMTQ
jgi:hypothetical protein